MVSVTFVASPGKHLTVLYDYAIHNNVLGLQTVGAPDLSGFRSLSFLQSASGRLRPVGLTESQRPLKGVLRGRSISDAVCAIRFGLSHLHFEKSRGPHVDR